MSSIAASAKYFSQLALISALQHREGIMYSIRPQIVIGLLVLSLHPAASAELISSFDEGQLDTTVWNACQIDQPPLTFEELTDAGGIKRRVLRNVVNPSTGNKDDDCNGVAAGGNAGLSVAVDEESESMGPS